MKRRGFSEDDLAAGPIDFSHMRIEKIDCQYFTFPFPTSFEKTTITGKAVFEGATFSEEAHFNKATFSSGAEFAGATFSQAANFYGTTFSGTADFILANFSEQASFNWATFSSWAAFKAAIFSSGANFNGSTFASFLSFKAAAFETGPPNFYNAKISEAISWTETRFPSTKGLSKDTADIHKDAYERLALMMDRLKKHHDQHRFFRLEMKARRAMERNPLLKFTNWLYQVMADYGYGFGRALTIWLANIGIGAALLFPYHDAALAAPSLATIGTAVKLWGTAVVTSFSNAHGFLGLNRTTLKETVAHYQRADLLLPYNVTATAQAIFGVIVLFFLVLTARNRFRMG